MIPPQPIIEDEEKELGTIEILEKNLGQICQLADQGEFDMFVHKGRERRTRKISQCEEIAEDQTNIC
jgi:hypothetical protein